MNRGSDIGDGKSRGAQISQLAKLDQILKGISGALLDEPGTLPGAKLFETNAQNAEYIFAAVLGNSECFR